MLICDICGRETTSSESTILNKLYRSKAVREVCWPCFKEIMRADGISTNRQAAYREAGIKVAIAKIIARCKR